MSARHAAARPIVCQANDWVAPGDAGAPAWINARAWRRKSLGETPSRFWKKREGLSPRAFRRDARALVQGARASA